MTNGLPKPKPISSGNTRMRERTDPELPDIRLHNPDTEQHAPIRDKVAMRLQGF